MKKKKSRSAFRLGEILEGIWWATAKASVNSARLTATARGTCTSIALSSPISTNGHWLSLMIVIVDEAPSRAVRGFGRQGPKVPWRATVLSRQHLQGLLVAVNVHTTKSIQTCQQSVDFAG